MTHNDSQVEAVMALVEEHGALKWGEGMSAGSHDKLSVRRFGAEAKEGLSEIRTALSALAAGKVEAEPALWQFRYVFADGRRGNWHCGLEFPRTINTGDSAGHGTTFEVRELFPAASPSPLSADPDRKGNERGL